MSVPENRSLCDISGHGTPCPYDMIINYKLAQLLEVRYDVNHTTEVNLRDTAVTFLNKLMKRDKK